MEQTNSAAVFSQGRLKIVPYGDSGLSGNGATYIPNLTPLYDLSDDDFIVSGAEDPVRVERKTNADAYNQVQIEYLDRANDYNIAVAEAKDQANIEQYGIRPKDAVKMHGICDAKVARQVAQLLLQRALYVRNEYEFKLGWKYCLLEPMDLVTLTDGGLGLDKTPVRITEIEEDEDGVLNVKAEDFPFGTASATEYPTQPSLGYSADYNVSPGNAHAPVMFEAPLQLTGGEPEIWLATAGGDMWGGAEVWVSTNGDSYTRVGAVSGKARYGSLTAALPAGAVFDRANTLGVEIGAGQLTGGTEQDSRDLLTLCYADGEFLAYETAELKGVGRYTLGNLTRGAYGSNIDRHEAGRPFVRVDESLFKYPVPRDWIGRTVWVKLVSHNVFGSGAQDLAEVPAYSYRIVGAPLGQVANLRLTSSWAYGREAVLAWDKLDGADTYDVEIYAAGSQTRLRAINGITANGYTYTLADMKADGGQVRNVVFKVRGRAVTGKTGAWAQVVAQNPQLKALTGIQIDSGLRQAFFQCEMPSEEDFAGIILWVSDNPACPTIDANRVYDGAETFVTIAKCNGNPLEGGKTYYVRAAGYDSFDKTGLQVSSSAAFTVYDVDVTVRDLAESSLNKALRDKIALIDGSGAGSVNARIQTAFRKAADDLTAKARELGTKITAEEAVNAEQARQIQAVTAAQGNTAAGLEAEKRARAEGDRAEAQARETLVGRVASAEGSINTLRETVVRNDGARAEEIRQLQAKFTMPDTRNDNQPPSWYFANHPRSTVSEFKQADVLGLGGGFAALETVVPWGDPSGGRIFQTAYLQDGTVMRRKSDTAHTYAGNGVFNYTKDLWTEWAADETANGAQAKADAVRRVAEAAQAAANRVDADFRQFASTQAGKDGATAQRISELSASIGGLQIGGRNLLRGSDAAYQGGDYGLSYGLADIPNVGEAVTLTVWGEVAADRTVGVYNTFGNRELARLTKVKDGVYRVTFDWNAPITGGREQPNASSKNLALFFYRRESTTVSRIDRIKLERGTVGTDWSPAPEDEAARREAALTAVTQTVERAVTKAEGDIRAATERITTLQTSVNGNAASIQTHARSINGLEAQYTVKVDVNGRVAGYGAATTLKNGVPESKFIITADCFGVGAVGKADIFPFTVDTQKNRVGVNGELVVNGKAIIDNLNAGTIHGDKIAANTLNANRIRAGSVTARELGVDKLSAISADMGNISGGSLNIGGGRFSVSNTGQVSISAASGNVGMKMTNDGIEVYDENGVLRVRLGQLS